MSGYSYNEILEREICVPTLVVMGAGINHDGLSEQSKLNAVVAAGLLIAELAPAEPVMAVGKSPSHIKGLDTTEADEMSKIIEDITFRKGLSPYVVVEDQSEDTIQNLQNIGQYIEEFNLDGISIVAAIGHADRARLMARKIFGKKLEVTPVYSDTDTRVLSQARELYSMGLYSLLTAFSKPDTRRLEVGNQAYRLSMLLPKRLASKSNISRSH